MPRDIFARDITWSEWVLDSGTITVPGSRRAAALARLHTWLTPGVDVDSFVDGVPDSAVQTMSALLELLGLPVAWAEAPLPWSTLEWALEYMGVTAVFNGDWDTVITGIENLDVFCPAILPQLVQFVQRDSRLVLARRQASEEVLLTGSSLTWSYDGRRNGFRWRLWGSEEALPDFDEELANGPQPGARFDPTTPFPTGGTIEGGENDSQRAHSSWPALTPALATEEELRRQIRAGREREAQTLRHIIPSWFELERAFREVGADGLAAAVAASELTGVLQRAQAASGEELEYMIGRLEVQARLLRDVQDSRRTRTALQTLRDREIQGDVAPVSQTAREHLLRRLQDRHEQRQGEAAAIAATVSALASESVRESADETSLQDLLQSELEGSAPNATLEQAHFNVRVLSRPHSVRLGADVLTVDLAIEGQPHTLRLVRIVAAWAGLPEGGQRRQQVAVTEQGEYLLRRYRPQETEHVTLRVPGYDGDYVCMLLPRDEP